MIYIHFTIKLTTKFITEIKINIILAGVLGLGIGIFFGMIRTFLNNSNVDERKKLRKFKNSFHKKRKDLIMDRRFTGTISFALLCGLPYYLGHQSESPMFFGLYSSKILILLIFYIITLISATSLFIYYSFKKSNSE